MSFGLVTWVSGMVEGYPSSPFEKRQPIRKRSRRPAIATSGDLEDERGDARVLSDERDRPDRVGSDDPAGHVDA